MDFNSSSENTDESIRDKRGVATEKLCGYLKKHKIGARGKTFKRRCTHGKTYCLEANDKNTLKYWLQELQHKRHEYSCNRLQSRQHLVKRSVQQPASGLVSLDTAALRQRLSSEDTPDLTDHVDVSMATMGEASALGDRGSFHDLSITNWRTELRNIMATRGQKKSDTADDQDVVDSTAPQHGKTRLLTFKKVVKHWKAASSTTSGSTGGKGCGQVSCSRCRELEDQLTSQKEDLTAAEEELAATREIMKILQKHIDTLERQNDTNPLEMEVSRLREEAAMYVESIQAKDQIIVSLTHGLQQLELDQSVTTDRSSTSSDASGVRPTQRFISDTRELDELRDMCTAYQEQNNFLNKEILELSKLRENDATGESNLS
ncbi:hypothetical protein NP493_3254g00002 [Ridgeia piscesae]|uniref:Uncharacterized protein n=1 Tax=Ridgeia piscesae TaxID=27915 RepID=A0AAD9MZ17_RIDPI|nr:hypothetical protein NP493_3254g00002 [Ridgeia piscesae]